MGDKNKAVAVVLLVLVLCQLTQAKAEPQLSYQDLVEDWEANNFQLHEIKLELADAERAYEQAKKDVNRASSSWSYLVDILNSIGREITPMMKFGTVMQRRVGLEKAERLYSQQELTAKTKYDEEYIRLRDYYFAYWQAHTQYEVNEKRLEIATIVKSKNDLLHKQSKVSSLDMKKSEITYLESEQELQKSKMLLAENRQQLNSYIGVELNTNYEVGIWEDQKGLSYNHVDKYVDKALMECLEIKQINDQIDINQLTIEAYDKYFSYNSMSERQQESYDNLKQSNETLSLQLAIKNTEVEKQLREMFLDINYEKYKLRILINLRNDANSNFIKTKELYDKGKASKIDLLQAEIKFIESKDNYLRSIYDFNTMIYKFNSLSSSGLSLGGKNKSQGGGY